MDKLTINFGPYGRGVFTEKMPAGPVQLEIIQDEIKHVLGIY